MEYRISAITDPFGEFAGSAEETNPEQAILRWCEYSEKYPTCVCIQPKTNEDGIKLLKWAEDNFDKVSTYLEKYNAPYKISWMKDMISAQLKNGKCSMQWEYDQLFPFCMG